MDTQEKCELLAEEIVSILKKGIRLGPKVAHFIESTCSNKSLQDLAAILEDESDCDRDTLLELIFFPDESIQAGLEDLLERLDIKTKEIPVVHKCLIQKDRLTTVYYPDTDKPLRIQMPESVVDQFLTRLNIEARLDKAVVDAIHKHVSENVRNPIKVKLRNVRTPTVGSQNQFLIAYFEKMQTSDSELIEGLELILDILGDLKDNADIYNGLMARKKFYFKSVLTADKYAAKLKKSNMEILMAQGLRTPYIDRSDAIRKIALIDKISISVFGKTQLLDRVADGIIIDGQDVDADLQKIIKLFSSN